MSTRTSQFGLVKTEIFLFFYNSFCFSGMGRNVEPGISPPGLKKLGSYYGYL